jgi:hypothetical protein
MRPAAIAIVVAMAPAAHADDTWHGSIGAGGSILITGSQDDRTRFDAAISVMPGGRFGRFGALAAVRAIDDDPGSAIVTAGVEYQAAASRPRLVLTLYADLGVETSATAPVIGAGSRTWFKIVGPLGLVADTGFHLVIDGADDTRLVIGSTLMLALIR